MTRGSIVSNQGSSFVVDFFGLSKDDASQHQEPFQKILEEVKPERDVNKRQSRKEDWWLFGENMPRARDSIKNLGRYIGTLTTAKHRVFFFLDDVVLPDDSLIAIGLNDAYFLGILSSSLHISQGYFILNSFFNNFSP